MNDYRDYSCYLEQKRQLSQRKPSPTGREYGCNYLASVFTKLGKHS